MNQTIKLQQVIIENSTSKEWEDAKKEWEVISCEEDETRSHSCCCGQSNLYYLFTIKNRLNDKQLFPIGSSCILKFENDEMTDTTTLLKNGLTEKIFYGKYNGKTYNEVFESDEKYIVWLIENWNPSLLSGCIRKNRAYNKLIHYYKRRKEIEKNKN